MCGIKEKRASASTTLSTSGNSSETRTIKQKKRECIAYARVSSAHQQQDLERQRQDLQKAYPDHELISDIGSGLNFKRKGLTALLERVLAGLVKEVVVMHKQVSLRIRAPGARL